MRINKESLKIINSESTIMDEIENKIKRVNASIKICMEKYGMTEDEACKSLGVKQIKLSEQEVAEYMKQNPKVSEGVAINRLMKEKYSKTDEELKRKENKKSFQVVTDKKGQFVKVVKE